MEIRRITAQGPESLGLFYTRMATDAASSKGGAAMLKLLDALASQSPDRVVWGAASSQELMLLLSDDPRGRAFATIKTQGPWYFIECAMSKSTAPWPDAWVKGHTSDVQQACGMLIVGWRWSQEAV